LPVQVYPLLAEGIKNGRAVTIISNHPRLEWTPHMTAIIEPFLLRLDNTKLIQARGDQFILERQPGPESHVTLKNNSATAQHVRIRYSGDDDSKVLQHDLSPGETWQL